MNDTVAVEETVTPVRPKKWYIVQAISNREKKVLQALTTRIEAAGLTDVFGQVLVPEEPVLEVIEGKSKRSMRKFFPGYVFVEMEFSEAAWHLIMNTTNVLGFIGGSPTRPAPVTTKEMALILDRMKAAEEAPAHKKEFTVGQRVLITSGAFKDFEGAVDEINYNQSKLTITISIFGRPTAMELEFGNVEKIT